ncbi:hypothetical protein [Sphingomonas panaciterrae]|uniref:hypothetical protein n=1 Tax=Sphingomonas panaciterrae TaxID=1462999 RepID=UPI002FEFD82A
MRPLPRWAVLAAAAGLVILGTLALTRCGAPSAERQAEQAVDLDRSEAAAEGYERGMLAERAATANQIERDAAFRNSQEELIDAAREADTGAGVGPATASVLERMRQQQAAGRRGDAAR